MKTFGTCWERLQKALIELSCSAWRRSNLEKKTMPLESQISSSIKYQLDIFSMCSYQHTPVQIQNIKARKQPPCEMSLIKSLISLSSTQKWHFSYLGFSNTLNTIFIRCSVGVQTYIHMKLDAGNAKRTTWHSSICAYTDLILISMRTDTFIIYLKNN